MDKEIALKIQRTRSVGVSVRKPKGGPGAGADQANSFIKTFLPFWMSSTRSTHRPASAPAAFVA